jgi:hypothetical protein
LSIFLFRFSALKFFFLRDFLCWLTVGKKKNLSIEKPLVSLLENLCGWLGAQGEDSPSKRKIH